MRYLKKYIKRKKKIQWRWTWKCQRVSIRRRCMQRAKDDAHPRDCCCWLLFLLKLLKIIKHEFGRWAAVAPSSLLIFHFYATDVRIKSLPPPPPHRCAPATFTYKQIDFHFFSSKGRQGGRCVCSVYVYVWIIITIITHPVVYCISKRHNNETKGRNGKEREQPLIRDAVFMIRRVYMSPAGRTGVVPSFCNKRQDLEKDHF